MSIRVITPDERLTLTQEGGTAVYRARGREARLTRAWDRRGWVYAVAFAGGGAVGGLDLRQADALAKAHCWTGASSLDAFDALVEGGWR